MTLTVFMSLLSLSTSFCVFFTMPFFVSWFLVFSFWNMLGGFAQVETSTVFLSFLFGIVLIYLESVSNLKISFSFFLSFSFLNPLYSSLSLQLGSEKVSTSLCSAQ